MVLSVSSAFARPLASGAISVSVCSIVRKGSGKRQPSSVRRYTFGARYTDMCLSLHWSERHRCVCSVVKVIGNASSKWIRILSLPSISIFPVRITADGFGNSVHKGMPDSAYNSGGITPPSAVVPYHSVVLAFNQPYRTGTIAALLSLSDSCATTMKPRISAGCTAIPANPMLTEKAL